MAKLAGTNPKRKHSDEVWREAMACEAQLDSLHQKMPENHQVSKALGHARSILGIVGHKQKCLSRFVHPAPNQRVRCASCGKRLTLGYDKKPLPHVCKVLEAKV